MPQTLSSFVGLTIIVLVCAAAARVGDLRLRGAATATVVGVIASLAAQQAAGAWDPVAPLSLVDAVVFAVLLGLAWRTQRRWPLWAVSFQGVTLAIDTLRFADAHMSPYVYLTAVAASTYGLVGTIGIAGWANWRAGRGRTFRSRR